MPLYDYSALDTLGKRKKGTLEAPGEREAKGILREQGLMVAEITLKKAASDKQNLKGASLLTFTLQLSQLIQAGVPLYESLIAIEEQYRNESFHRILLGLCEKIKAGTSLSEAMALYPGSFDKLYRAMIAAGESIGALDVVLEKLTHFLTRQTRLKKQIITAMIYPGILASFSFLIIILLLGFVVPSIEGIFADRKLNGLTSFVLQASHFFRNYWWLYIPTVIAVVIGIVLKLKSDSGRLWIERTLLKTPIIRTLVIQTSLARFCRTMGTLQTGGLPLIDSLQISRGVMSNVVLEGEIKEAEERIIEGSSLSAELSRSKYIPSMVARMLAVGEDSGTTVIMFNKLADMYEDEVEKSLDRVMALSQPVILIIMGTIIGIVMMAILLPLTDVSSFAM